jgi:glycosyltransferase involved in cell wall biosynthesis
MQEQRVSIIIPTLNEKSKIGLLLEHLRNMYPARSMQIIVVDSAKSTDDIEAIVKSYDALYVKSENESRAAQLSEGALFADAPVFCFIHADVFPAEGFIEALLAELADGTEFGYFSYHFDSPSFLLKLNAWFTQFKGFFTGGGDQMLFIKKAVYMSSGGFDPKQEFMEDFELHYRLKHSGFSYSIIHLPSLVSARKYDHNPYWKVNYLNFITLFDFKRGKNIRMLKLRYQTALKTA